MSSSERSGEIRGIHHVTAIASDPQTDLDFYAGLLGLRLVKKTVNFDDPGTYHLYFGDQAGRPGSILTFFPWPGARRGQRGVGQATTTSFAVPEGALGYWVDRFRSAGVAHESPGHRFDEETLVFLDPDGLKLELVARPGLAESPFWTGGGVPETVAIRRFSGVTLHSGNAAETSELLTAMGFQRRQEEGAGIRFTVGEGEEQGTVDLEESGGHGRSGAGTVHHVAWRVADDAAQLTWRDRLRELGHGVTDVKDRNYFRSIYYREPGGVLFEIATDPPGFTADEPLEDLGEELRLPSWLESRRQLIEARLPALQPARVDVAREVRS